MNEMRLERTSSVWRRSCMDNQGWNEWIDHYLLEQLCRVGWKVPLIVNEVSMQQKDMYVPSQQKSASEQGNRKAMLSGKDRLNTSNNLFVVQPFITLHKPLFATVFFKGIRHAIMNPNPYCNEQTYSTYSLFCIVFTSFGIT